MPATKSLLKFYVYVYRDARPGKRGVPIYVGKGAGDRAYEQLRARRNGNGMLRIIIRKHRDLSLEPRVKIVARFATEIEALTYEISLIAKYGRRNIGTGTLCNLTDGGEGVSGRIVSAKMRRAIAKAASKAMTAAKRKAIKTGQKEYWTEENRRAWAIRMSKQMLEEKPRLRAKRRAWAKILGRRSNSDPTIRNRRIRNLKRYLSDPKVRIKIAAQLRKQQSDPTWWPRNRAGQRRWWRRYWSDPRLQKARSIQMKRAWAKRRAANGH